MAAFPFLAALLASALGCRTVPPADVVAFAGGVTQAKQQANLAFRTLNELSRESTIAFAATQPTLNEDLFEGILDPDAMANWEQAFAGIETYAQHLMVLTSPNLTQEYKEYAVNLAEQVRTTGQSLANANIIPNAPELSAPLAAGFVKIGDVLIRAGAQTKAKAILREVDPDVMQLFSTMAGAIGSTRGEGLRGTAWAHWTQKKAENQVAFLSATSPGQKRSIVEAFVKNRESQITHDAALASLERSLRALANAHRSLAQGRNFDAISALALVHTEVDDTKQLFAEFRRALNAQP